MTYQIMQLLPGPVPPLQLEICGCQPHRCLNADYQIGFQFLLSYNTKKKSCGPFIHAKDLVFFKLYIYFLNSLGHLLQCLAVCTDLLGVIREHFTCRNAPLPEGL